MDPRFPRFSAIQFFAWTCSQIALLASMAAASLSHLPASLYLTELPTSWACSRSFSASLPQRQGLLGWNTGMPPLPSPPKPPCGRLPGPLQHHGDVGLSGITLISSVEPGPAGKALSIGWAVDSVISTPFQLRRFAGPIEPPGNDRYGLLSRPYRPAVCIARLPRHGVSTEVVQPHFCRPPPLSRSMTMMASCSTWLEPADWLIAGVCRLMKSESAR